MYWVEEDKIKAHLMIMNDMIQSIIHGLLNLFNAYSKTWIRSNVFG